MAGVSAAWVVSKQITTWMVIKNTIGMKPYTQSMVGNFSTIRIDRIMFYAIYTYPSYDDRKKGANANCTHLVPHPSEARRLRRRILHERRNGLHDAATQLL
jgi:hypothetical protein